MRTLVGMQAWVTWPCHANQLPVKCQSKSPIFSGVPESHANQMHINMPTNYRHGSKVLAFWVNSRQTGSLEILITPPPSSVAVSGILRKSGRKCAERVRLILT